MTYKIEVTQKQKLDNPRRRELMPPFETLKSLGLGEGETVADIGCGIGYFTLPAARIVGEGGRVYAVDYSAEMLEDAKKAAAENNITNIEFYKSDEYDFKLKSNSVTYCFICIVLHEIDDLHSFIREVRRVLVDGGKMVAIEWKKKDENWGPAPERQLKSARLTGILSEEGFSITEQLDIGEFFYAVIGKKEGGGVE